MERKAFTEQAIEHKQFIVELKAADEKELTVEHFISTERRDRGGDILKADGMVVEGRPVVLLGHGQGVMGSEPVAKNLWLRVAEYGNNKGVLAKTQFFPDETGKRLFLKTSTGYSPNWSIGWRPLKWRMERDQATNDETRIVEKWELLEYSLVGVPMQPDAQTLSQHGMAFKTVDEDLMSDGPHTITIPDSLIAQIIKDTMSGIIKKALQDVKRKIK